MDKKLKRKNRRLSNLYIAMWTVPVILVWMVILLNYLTKGSREILKTYIYAMLFVLLVFSPGIVFNIILRKKTELYTQRKRFIFFFIQLAFMGCAFVGLVEGGLDAAKTTEQVKQVIGIIKNAKKEIYLESIDVEIGLEDEYQIGDVINFNIKYEPVKATEKDIIVDIDNKIVNVDLSNNKITCLENGTCTIKFYDSHKPEVMDSIKIVISSVVLESIEIPTNNKGTKDLFLAINEEYKLAPIIYPSDLENVDLQYISEDPSIASVDLDGNIIGIKAGTTKITCYDGNVKDEIYVTVDPITELVIETTEYVIKPGRNNIQAIFLYPNALDSYDEEKLSINYSNDYDLTLNGPGLNQASEVIVYSIINDEYELIGNHLIDFEIVYEYPGGYKISVKFEVILEGYQVFDVENIDLDNTALETTQTVYYDENGNLISKYIDIPIAYKKANNDGANNFKVESAIAGNDVNFENTTYDLLNITFDDLSDVKDYYEVNFYPNKKSEKYVTFKINIDKQQSSIDDSTFEMTNLYNKDEGKNQIWYAYFNEQLFNQFSFLNEEFENSGLKFEFSDTFKEAVNYEVNDLGFVTKAELKNKVNNWYIEEELYLPFTVCSLYEYNKDSNCKKYEYVIEVKNEFDGLEISINGSEFATEYDDIVMEKGTTLSFVPKYIINLEYKGSFQEQYIYGDFYYISNDEKVVVTGHNNIEAVNYGTATLTYSYYPPYFEKTYTININVIVVNDEGFIPTNPEISLEVVSYNEKCPPVLEQNQFSVGTILKFSIHDFDCYDFVSLNTNILKFINSNQAECLKSGNVTIYAVNRDNPTEILVYTVDVYNAVEDFTVKKGSFIEVDSSASTIKIEIKTNKRYTFALSVDQDYSFINRENNKNLVLDENGGVLVTKAGKYYVEIVVGEEGSPYKITKTIVLTSTDDGITANYRYFIRKAIGHFGLFFVTGIFACIALLFINCFKIKNKYIIIAFTLVFGIFLAFATEYMQKTDPSRFFSVSDILLDSYGYLTAFILIFGIYLLKLRKAKKKSKKESK